MDKDTGDIYLKHPEIDFNSYHVMQLQKTENIVVFNLNPVYCRSVKRASLSCCVNLDKIKFFSKTWQSNRYSFQFMQK